MIIKFLSKLLSGSDEVSSNRTVAMISFIVFIFVILYSICNELFNDHIISYLEFLLVIILAGLGLKGIEKISGIIKRK